jgi:hypothetical protein
VLSESKIGQKYTMDERAHAALITDKHLAAINHLRTDATLVLWIDSFSRHHSNTSSAGTLELEEAKKHHRSQIQIIPAAGGIFSVFILRFTVNNGIVSRRKWKSMSVIGF